MAVTGGEAITLAITGETYGGTWYEDRILYSQGQSAQIYEVPASGGEPLPLAANGYWPHLSPRGDALLLTDRGLFLFVVDLATGEAMRIADGAMAAYVTSGHIVYGRADGLWAVPFDLDQRATTGSPMRLAGDMRREADIRAAQFAVSQTGILAYAPGPDLSRGQLVWAGVDGQIDPLPFTPAELAQFELSPDGSRIVTTIDNDIWLYDLERQSPTRITQEGSHYSPTWHPDGQTVTFLRLGVDRPGIYSRLVDGTGASELLVANYGDTVLTPASWSPDGRKLFVIVGDGPQNNLRVLDPVGASPPLVITDTSAREWWGAFSPDGEWIAYGSTESGADQVYVQPFPPTGQRWQVSVERGAEEPRWSANGEELVYRSGRRWLSVSRREGAPFPWTPPRVVREGDFINVPGLSWDMTNDGARFLLVQGADALPFAATLNVILNWTRLLAVD